LGGRKEGFCKIGLKGTIESGGRRQKAEKVGGPARIYLWEKEKAQKSSSTKATKRSEGVS